MDPHKEQEPQSEEQTLSEALAEHYEKVTEPEMVAAEDAETEEAVTEDDVPADDDVTADSDPVEQAAEASEATEASDDEEPVYNEEAPERWPREIKETYQSLPPEAKKAFLEGIYRPMQKAYTERTQQMAQMKARLDPMAQAMQNYQGVFEQAGVDPVQAFRDNIAWAAHFAKVGPQQGAKDMMAAVGGQQPAGSEAGVQAASDEWMTPTEKALQRQLDEQSAALNRITASRQQEREQQAIQNQQNAQMAGVQNELATFASATTPEGTSLHPHLEQVAPQMAGLIRGNLVTKVDHVGNPVPISDQLQQAYDMAVRMDSKLSQARADAAERERQAARVAAASREVPSAGRVAPVEGGDNGPLSDTIQSVYASMARS